MDRPNHSQLELFSQEKEYSQIKSTSGINSFFKNIKIYEKRVLLIIAFIFTAVISFSIGAEKGKKNTYSRTDSNFNLALKENPVSNQKILVPQATNSSVNVSINQKKAKENVSRILVPANTLIRTQEKTNIVTQNFTIQLATYKTKTFAQREADNLKNKGLTPILLSKTGLSVLCVGSFTSRESAQSLLSQLKKRYPDCYIRRL